jgi:N utilization substance protein B
MSPALARGKRERDEGTLAIGAWTPNGLTSNMSRRSRAREVALQMLYQEDMNPSQDLLAIRQFVSGRLQDDEDLVSFAMSLINGVLRNRQELDQLLQERAANWSLARMAVTDRNVLRIGAYEILYTDTPGRVVINEAIELARRFGSKQSSQFVNGILDPFLKEK